MKKALIALILAVIFVLSFTLYVSAADTDENTSANTEGDIILGDVNGDGLITNADVLMIYRYIYNSELYPLPTICDHNYDDWTIEALATCETDGEISRTCTKCSKTETSTVKGGHIYEETVVAPTPADDGYTKHECQRCGDIYKDSFVPALGFTNFSYSINADGKSCTVTGLEIVPATEVTIPEKIDGYVVTAIGNKAFANCTTLTKIIIPDTVKSIGPRAFYGCTGITEMTIPASVTDIGTQIFYKASNLSTVYYNSTYTSESNPFLNLDHIQKVVFGGNNVPSSILKGHTYIKEIEVLSNVKYINASAFSGCTSLEKITVPIVGAGNSYTHFGSIFGASSYEDNSSCVPKTLKTVIVIGGTNIGYYAFYGCTSLTSITIPDSVTSIGQCAFKSCTSLESITIPDSVERIGDDAFYSCTSLKEIYISDIEAWLNISFISASSNPCYKGADLYLNGELLTSVYVPDSVTSIGDYALYNCTSLESVTIPDSVTSISSYAFYWCTSLTSITIPDSVMSIGEHAFSGCAFASIEIPDSVTSIGDYAFSSCTSLVDIKIPDSVTSIGDYALYNCTSLESVTIPDSVTSISSYAFYWCTSLTSITIPDSVTSISSYAFNYCPSLKDVYYTGTQEQWRKISKGSNNSYLTSATIHYNHVAA